MFSDPKCISIVAEIQLVHNRFLDIRVNFGAHDSYDAERFAAEMRRHKTGEEQHALPDSQSSSKAGCAITKVTGDDRRQSQATTSRHNVTIEMVPLRIL